MSGLHPDRGARGVELVVDAANVVGARPDGWWRDRAGATHRLLVALSGWPPGRVMDLPAPGGWVRIDRTHAVLEGAARSAEPASTDSGVVVHLAPRDGDATVVALVASLVADGLAVVVVSADRGLLARLPAEVGTAGPGWLRSLLDDDGDDGEG